MYYGFLQFNSIPEIGFAHHFESSQYQMNYRGHQKNFEVACNITGEIQMELYGKSYTVREGSIFLVFRDLPICLISRDEGKNEHYTVQLGMEYDFSLIRDETPPPEQEGILLPLIIPPGKVAEEIRRELISIVLEMERESDRSSFGASLRVLEILRKMDGYARSHRKEMNHSPGLEQISRQVKRVVAGQWEKKLTLSQIAREIGKTPNYINYAFRQVNGITINRYINGEKVKIMAEKILKNGFSFEKACEEAGVSDVSYGYRLFKRYMGVTPGNYRKGKIFRKARPTVVGKTTEND